MSIFEKAARSKARFESPKGLLSVEDLWDLPLTTTAGRANLDDIARSLHQELKSESNVSFVNPTVKTNADVQLKFDVVKHIIDTRLAEAKARSDAEDKKTKRNAIMAAIAEKEGKALSEASIEELRKQLETL